MSDPTLQFLQSVAEQIASLKQRVSDLEGISSPGYVTYNWSPTLVGSTIPGTYVYAATTGGRATRIGNTVFFRGRLTLTSVSIAPTGVLSIFGLPIAAATLTLGFVGSIHFSFYSLFNLGGNTFSELGAVIASGATSADILKSKNDGTAGVNVTGAGAAVAAGTDLMFTGQYQV